jgi:hypothetical protein
MNTQLLILEKRKEIEESHVQTLVLSGVNINFCQLIFYIRQ